MHQTLHDRSSLWKVTPSKEVSTLGPVPLRIISSATVTCAEGYLLRVVLQIYPKLLNSQI